MSKTCKCCGLPFEVVTKKERRRTCCSNACAMSLKIAGRKAALDAVSDIDRFMKFVIPVTESGCWLWTGRCDEKALPSPGYGHGHGQFTADKRRLGAHRWYYEQVKGPVQEGLHLDHLCRVRCCVNPDHLEPVTPRVNILRGIGPAAENVQKEYCVRGHSLAAENLLNCKDKSRRVCRQCKREYARQRIAKKQLV